MNHCLWSLLNPKESRISRSSGAFSRSSAFGAASLPIVCLEPLERVDRTGPAFCVCALGGLRGLTNLSSGALSLIQHENSVDGDVSGAVRGCFQNLAKSGIPEQNPSLHLLLPVQCRHSLSIETHQSSCIGVYKARVRGRLDFVRALQVGNREGEVGYLCLKSPVLGSLGC